MDQPNPTACAEHRDPRTVERLQHVTCRYRSTVCLSIAAASDWRGFDCTACEAFRPSETWRDEVDGLAAFGRMIAKLAAAPDSAVPKPLRLVAPTTGTPDVTTVGQDVAA